jgi:cell division protein FtsW
MKDARAQVWHPIRPEAFVVVCTALMAFGLVIVASATATLDRPLLGDQFWRSPFGRQLGFVGVGLLLMAATVPLAMKVLQSISLRKWFVTLFFVLSVLLLAAALVPGIADPHRGSNRWLRVSLGGMEIGFQPSEVAKLALVAFVAWMLTERLRDPRRFWFGVLPVSFLAAVCIGLVGKENLGTAALLALVAAAMLLVGGCRILHLSLMASAGAAGLVGLLLAAPYRMERVTAFRDIWADPQGAGYQPIQSLTSIATGGWQGVGLGNGIQKFGYLPESHTDFVFAILCEETGIVGGGLVIALFCAFAWLGVRAMMAAATPFERMLAFGITMVITAQAAINIAVVTVMMPTTGVPLPMISAGGSGLLMVCVAVGLLCAIARRGAMVDPAPAEAFA